MRPSPGLRPYLVASCLLVLTALVHTGGFLHAHFAEPAAELERAQEALAAMPIEAFGLRSNGALALHSLHLSFSVLLLWVGVLGLVTGPALARAGWLRAAALVACTASSALLAIAAVTRTPPAPFFAATLAGFAWAAVSARRAGPASG